MKTETQIKSIIEEFKRLKAPMHVLENFQVFLSSYQEHSMNIVNIDSVFVSFYEQLKTINEKYIYDIDHLFQSKQENTEKFSIEKETQRTKYVESLNQFDQDYVKQKKEIELKYQEEKRQLNNDIKAYENEKNKHETIINKQISEIKKIYELKVLQIEQDSNIKENEAKTKYVGMIHTIQEDINAQEKEFDTLHTQYLKNRETESTSHDTDYIDIKSHYNIVNKTLNKYINSLKQKRNDALALVDNKLQESLIPIENSILQKEEKIKKLKNERLLKREKEIKNLQERKLVETERYKDNQNKIITQTSEAVSILNSKLSNYREITTEKKRKIVRDFQTKSMSSKNETIQKNRQLTQLDNDLNQLIIKTRKEIKYKKAEGQLLLFELNKNYQILIADIEFLIKKELYDTTYDLKKYDIELKQHHELLQEQQQKLQEQRHFYQDSIEAAYQKDVLSFETQINLASQSQERDLGQLVLDASIDITHIDKNILEIQSIHTRKILKLQHQIDLHQLQFDNTIQTILLNKNQLLDQASRTRDLDLEELQLRLDLKQETFDEQTANFKHQLETLFIHYEKDLFHHENRYEYQKENHKLTHEYKSLKRQYTLNEYNDRVSLRKFHLDFSRSEHIIDIHIDLFYTFIQKIFDVQFQHVSLLNLSVQLLEQTFHYHENPETMRHMIDIVQTLNSELQLSFKSSLKMLKETFIDAYQTHFENARNVVLQMHYKDAKIMNKHTIDNLQKEKAELVKKKYEFEVAMKQSSTTKDDLALKRIEKAYNKINTDINSIEDQIKQHTHQADADFNIFKSKFNLWIQKKFTHITHIISKIEKTEQSTMHFFDMTLQQNRKLSQTLYYTNQIIFGVTKSIQKQYMKYIEQQQLKMYPIYQLLLNYQKDMKRALHDEKQNKTILIENSIHDWEQKQQQHQLSFDQENNFSRRTFRESIVAKKNAVELKIANYHRDFQEAKDKRLRSIQRLENLLQSFASKKTLTLDTLEVNQQAIVEQEQHKLNHHIQQLLTRQQKIMDNFDAETLKKQQDYDEKILHALSSIEQRLVKYLTSVSKLREVYKDKMIDKTLHETKINQNYKKRLVILKQKTSRLITEHKKEKRLHLIQLDKHEKREQVLLHKKHQSIEFWLKKSYQFKIKTLDFN